MKNQDIIHESFLENSEYEIRKKKSVELKKKNINPWPQFIGSYSTSDEITNKEIIENDTVEYIIVGRVIGIREHGKSIFITIQDSCGAVQGYSKNESGDESFNFLKKYVDLGDFVSICGNLFLTRTNEKTIRIQKVAMLSKCLHAIPDKHVGFENVELRYRQRYVDLLVNDSVKEIFKKRSALIEHIRLFLNSQNYLEVETPMLHPIVGGAAAKPFITHHNALATDLYLRIAPELYLKRLVVGGFDKVYEINKNFRNEGVSIRHNPEFTMLEFYTAYQDYNWAMDFVEELLKSACFKLNQSYESKWNEYQINFGEPFDRITPLQAILKYTNFTEKELSEKSIDTIIAHLNPEKNISYQQKLFLVFESYAEKRLIKPTFLIDFPIELSPLTKKDEKNPTIAPRFELFICGMEISNGYNELNDPFDQADRFKEQVKSKESGNEEAMHYDQEFITALEYALPPTVGVGIGIDRLAMLLTGAKSIKDVILFPTMKKI